MEKNGWPIVPRMPTFGPIRARVGNKRHKEDSHTMHIQTARIQSDVTLTTLNHFLPYLSASRPKGIAMKRPMTHQTRGTYAQIERLVDQNCNQKERMVPHIELTQHLMSTPWISEMPDVEVALSHWNVLPGKLLKKSCHPCKRANSSCTGATLQYRSPICPSLPACSKKSRSVLPLSSRLCIKDIAGVQSQTI